jgi:K+ transporter
LNFDDTNESIIVWTSLIGGSFLLNASNWTPAFAGETNIREAWFFVVIPAEAGIQADEKIKSMARQLWPY